MDASLQLLLRARAWAELSEFSATESNIGKAFVQAISVFENLLRRDASRDLKRAPTVPDLIDGLLSTWSPKLDSLDAKLALANYWRNWYTHERYAFPRLSAYLASRSSWRGREGAEELFGLIEKAEAREDAFTYWTVAHDVFSALWAAIAHVSESELPGVDEALSQPETRRMSIGQKEFTPANQLRYSRNVALDEGLTHGIQEHELIDVSFVDDRGGLLGSLGEGMSLSDVLAGAPTAVLIGESGIGKSVALGWLTRRQALEAFDNPARLLGSLDDPDATSSTPIGVPWPIAVDLRDYVADPGGDDSLLAALERIGVPRSLARYSERPTTPETVFVAALLRSEHCLLVVDGLDVALRRPESRQRILSDLGHLAAFQRDAAGLQLVIACMEHEYELHRRQIEPLLKSHTRVLVPRLSEESVRLYLGEETYNRLAPEIRQECRNTLVARMLREISEDGLESEALDLPRIYERFAQRKLKSKQVVAPHKWRELLGECALTLERQLRFRYPLDQFERLARERGLLTRDYMNDEDRLLDHLWASGLGVRPRDATNTGEFEFVHARVQTYFSGVGLSSLYEGQPAAATRIIEEDGRYLLDCLPFAAAYTEDPDAFVQATISKTMSLPTRTMARVLNAASRRMNANRWEQEVTRLYRSEIIGPVEEEEIEETIATLATELGLERMLTALSRTLHYPSVLAQPDANFGTRGQYRHRAAFAAMASLATDDQAATILSDLISTSPFRAVSSPDEKLAPEDPALAFDLAVVSALQQIGERRLEQCRHVVLKKLAESMMLQSGASAWLWWQGFRALLSFPPSEQDDVAELVHRFVSEAMSAESDQRGRTSPTAQAVKDLIAEACASRSTDALPHLTSWLADDRETVRQVALECLQRVIETDGLTGENPRLRTVIIQRLSEKSLEASGPLIQLLGYVGTEADVPILFEHALSDDAEIRWLARHALIRLGSEEAAAGLAGILEGADPEEMFGGTVGTPSSLAVAVEVVGNALGILNELKHALKGFDINTPYVDQLDSADLAVALARRGLLEPADVMDHISELGPSPYSRELIVALAAAPGGGFDAIVASWIRAVQADGQAQRRFFTQEVVQAVVSTGFLSRVPASQLVDLLASVSVDWLVHGRTSTEHIALGSSGSLTMREDWSMTAESLGTDASRPAQAQWSQAIVVEAASRATAEEIGGWIERDLAFLSRPDPAGPDFLPCFLPSLTSASLFGLLDDHRADVSRLLSHALGACLSQERIEEVTQLTNMFHGAGSIPRAFGAHMAISGWEWLSLQLIDAISDLRMLELSARVRQAIDTPSTKLAVRALQLLPSLEGTQATEILEQVVMKAVATEARFMETRNREQTFVQIISEIAESLDAYLEYMEAGRADALGKAAIAALAELGPIAEPILTREEVRALAPDAVKEALASWSM